MGILKAVTTWWEDLGLTRKEADVLADLIEKTATRKAYPILCPSCNSHYNSNDFHDCKGKFDELRWRLEGKLTNSMKTRLYRKYGKSEKLQAQAEEYLDSLGQPDYANLVTAYEEKIKAIELGDSTWYVEQELWNS